MEFTHPAEQLSLSISDYERLIGENSLRIEQIRVQSQEVTEQLEELTKECVELDLEVREQREELEPLEDRLERRRPSSRRLDKDDTKGTLW